MNTWCSFQLVSIQIVSLTANLDLRNTRNMFYSTEEVFSYILLWFIGYASLMYNVLLMCGSFNREIYRITLELIYLIFYFFIYCVDCTFQSLLMIAAGMAMKVFIPGER